MEPIDNTPFPGSWRRIHVLAVLNDDPAALEAELAPVPALPHFIDARTLGGSLTPLALAAEWGHVGVMAWLLRHGADPTLANDDGMAPLALAARAGRVEAVQLLLSLSSVAGALLAQVDRWGRVPLVVAVAHGQAAAFACLLDVALAQAGPAAADREAVLEGLYATGAGDGESTTLLIHACRLGHAPIVRTLLTRGADPCHSHGGVTPLTTAEASGSGGRACKVLLEEWQRMYALAKARAVHDAELAAAAVCPHAPSSPSLDVVVEQRTGQVAAEVVKGMADDVFTVLLGLMGGRTTGEEMEEGAGEIEVLDGMEDLSMGAEEEENGEEEGCWDW